jgi:VWFA-related protein
MTWRHAITLALTVAAGGTLAAQSVFRSGVDGVTVVVSVHRGNQPLSGLSSGDFELKDNGVAQQISSISAETVPLDLTLLLDLSSSVDGPQLQRLKAAVNDTAGLLRADDRIRLVAISQVLHEVFSLRPKGSAMLLEGLTAEGATSLYDGMAATMMRPSEPGRRQLIVAFTDGRDSTSIIDERTAKAIARQTDAVVDLVVPIAAPTDAAGTRRLAQRFGTLDSLSTGDNVVAGKGSSPTGAADTIPPVLAELVAPTAGQVIPLADKQSISVVFKAMLDDFRASYVLRYVAQGVADEGWHEIAVSVKKRGRYEIRARRGYMGRGRIGSSEAPGDSHRSARVVRPRLLAGAEADVQVRDRPGRGRRGDPRQGR